MTWLLRLFTGLKGIWGYAAAALGAIAAVVGIYLAGRKAARDAIKAKQREKAAKVKDKAHKAAIKGIKRYEASRKKPVDRRNIRQFER